MAITTIKVSDEDINARDLSFCDITCKSQFPTIFQNHEEEVLFPSYMYLALGSILSARLFTCLCFNFFHDSKRLLSSLSKIPMTHQGMS